MNKNQIDPKKTEKKQNRYVFACAGSILYIMPCVMCLWVGIMAEGFTYAFIFALVTIALALPVGLLGLKAYKKRSLMKFTYAACAVMIALHVYCIFGIGAWYLIMSPALILYSLMILFGYSLRE